jgi:NAD-dependent deacetylase
VKTLADALLAARSPVVLTGAGMSVASGIPTFRGTDPDAVWARDVMELGTFRFFRQDPVASWRWYRSRFAAIEGAEPNAGHHALAALERWQAARGRDWLLVTQNIDTLHARAGSQALVEVHGRADRVRCVSRACPNAGPNGSLARSDIDFATFDAAPSLATLPRCPACSSPVRAHVLWFDESYTDHADYQFQRVMSAFARADLLLFVGTSFSVGITAAALDAPAPKWSIDAGDGEAPDGVRLVRGAQEVLLPELALLSGA